MHNITYLCACVCVCVRVSLFLWEVRVPFACNILHKTCRLFRRHPDTKQKFEKFRHIHHSKLHNSPAMAAHALTFMYSMNSIMNNVNDLEVLDEIMRSIAENHKKRGILPQHFEVCVD